MKQETRKTWKLLGQKVGIDAQRESQRGIIALKFLRLQEKLELENFGLRCKHIQLS
jgi:hypothetical protein